MTIIKFLLFLVFSQPCAAQSSLKDMNWDQEQWKPLICKLLKLIWSRIIFLEAFCRYLDAMTILGAMQINNCITITSSFYHSHRRCSIICMGKSLYKIYIEKIYIENRKIYSKATTYNRESLYVCVFVYYSFTMQVLHRFACN